VNVTWGVLVLHARLCELYITTIEIDANVVNVAPDRVDDTFLTVPEVAERLRVTAMTIYRWIEDGKLPAVQIAKHYRIRASDLEQMLETSRVGADRPDPWSAELPNGPSVE
jgi:excisionase family DNA binding protein